MPIPRPAIPAALKTLVALALLAAFALIIYAAFPHPAPASTHPIDYDMDDDGLIEITTIQQLHIIRRDHDGDGAVASSTYPAHFTEYNAAFPRRTTAPSETDTSTPRMGCPAACRGFELMNDLDFATATTSLRNWPPGWTYEGILEGNGYTIANLNAGTNNAGASGFFPALDPTAIVRNVGLIDPSASGRGNVGTLAAVNRGTIYASYAVGGTSTIATQAATSVGGLVGLNNGSIIASFARVSVSGNAGANTCRAGGLVGRIQAIPASSYPGAVIASYAAGTTTCTSTSNTFRLRSGQADFLDITANLIGGLAGEIQHASSTIINSACDNEAAGLTTPCIPYIETTIVDNYADSPPSYDTAEMQAPTAYTGIYAHWNVDLDGDTLPDNPWNFRTSSQYPIPLKPAERTAAEQDYDSDDDNLIDIRNLHQLNAVRHDLNGDGLPGAAADYPAYAGAFPGGDLASATPTEPRLGCPQTCTGYELMQSLDFAADGTTVTTTDPYPNWVPIGGIGLSGNEYAADFDGNGHTISNLTISHGDRRTGLFGRFGPGAIRDLGLVNPSVTNANTGATTWVGALAGVVLAGGSVSASYVDGGATTALGRSIVGGMVGYHSGELRAVWSTTAVDGGGDSNSSVGGLIGTQAGSGALTIASYAAGPVAASTTDRGGFVGNIVTGGAINHSYCDTTVHAATTTCNGTGTPVAVGQDTAQLQTPAAYAGIYANWNIDVDGDAFPDNPWNFGASNEYPTLKTAAQRQAAATGDYDTDDDNLIDIRSVYQLNAIRHDLNGDGNIATASRPAYAGAFPNAHLNMADTSTTVMGCPQTCLGYELRQNLDFAAAPSGATRTNPYPNWSPIGLGTVDGTHPQYIAAFDGNGHTISNLAVTAGELHNGITYSGLFGSLGPNGSIRDVGLIEPSIAVGGGTGPAPLGGPLSARVSIGAEVTASYVQGGSVTIDRLNSAAGGLVGVNAGTIRASWSTAAVNGGAYNFIGVGGLVGEARDDSRIIASYAAGPVEGTGSSGASVGGLVGAFYSNAAAATVVNSHCDTAVPTTTIGCIGTYEGSVTQRPDNTPDEYTTAQLQTPDTYTGPYAHWNLSLDGDDFPDQPWNFGAANEYPTLKTPTQRENAPVNDYDQDNDNLIDINTLDQLNAIRHDLDGSGLPAATSSYVAYAGAFPGGQLSDTTTPYMGCAATCLGYELMQSLDFAADGTAVTGTDAYPNWTPIGDLTNPYAAQFHGRGYTITRLTIDTTGYAGLFHTIGASAVIRDVGMLDASVASNGAQAHIGILAAANNGEIRAAYALRGAVTASGTVSHAGGLVGQNVGAIRAAYATASVDAGAVPSIDAGGLVGVNHNGAITAAYAAGAVSGTGSGANIGGLVGRATGAAAAVTDSYCDTQTTGQTDCIGTVTGSANAAANIAPGQTTAQLQTPTTYTGPYANWNLSLDADDFPDYPWNFGAANEYPTLNTPAQREAQAAQVTDYDQNDNNLIDIRTLDQLNAIRYDLDGNGLPNATGSYPGYVGAFPHGNLANTGTPYMGCAATCIGYELMQSLDFAADNTAVTTTDLYPDWTPIGDATNPYAAQFQGNANTITRLTIDGAAGDAGLFHTIAAGAAIRELGMLHASVTGAGANTGILTAVNLGEITASYIQDGSVTATGTGSGALGALTGRNAGQIRAAYATAAVNAGARASLDAGGLAGRNDGGQITASYAAGPVTGTGAGANIGGLTGRVTGANAAITDSHCDTQTTGQADCIGAGATAAAASNGYTTAQLQTPTGYTGPYANWNISIDADQFPDYPWNFGTTSQYPTLNTAAQRQTQAAPTIDYDQNDNNLIDISTLHQLNAIRHDLDGNGIPNATGSYPGYVGAFPNGNLASTATPYMGCAATCIGYELTADLDFAANANANPYPNWQSIGDETNPYTAQFEGNTRAISNLTITSGANAGLFGALGNGGIIRDLKILTPDISGETAVGAFAAIMTAGSIISTSYIQGGAITLTNAGDLGGLVGQLSGTIRASHASTTAITGSAGNNIGGLAGKIEATGMIIASYAAAPVTGSGNIGGVAGRTEAGATITASYCDATVSGEDDAVGTGSITANCHPTGALQSPTGYSGLYQSWNLDLNGDDTPDYPWYFGTSAEYPELNTPTQRTEQRTSGDVPPPPLPRAIIPEPPKPYDPAADHPEIYENTEYEITATCQTRNPDPETNEPQAATITFNLGNYHGPILLALSIWTGSRYMAYETQNIPEPTLQRQGQTATLNIETNPTQTRFRLDGTRNGLRANLVLGYANCQTN